MDDDFSISPEDPEYVRLERCAEYIEAALSDNDIQNFFLQKNWLITFLEELESGATPEEANFRAYEEWDV